MTKGIEFNEKIEYQVKPKPIIVRELGHHKVCDNCASHGDFMCYEIRFNNTDFRTPSGNIGKKRYAKLDVIWLCEDCLNELKEALKDKSE